MGETLSCTHRSKKELFWVLLKIGLPLRFFLSKPTDKSLIKAFINPKIIHTVDATPEEIEHNKTKRKKLFEGCLSVPNFWGNVTRAKEVTLTWQDPQGKTHTKEFRGFMATIIQHEIDHLDGTLFTKHVMEQGEKLYKSHKNEKGEDEFDEVKI